MLNTTCRTLRGGLIATAALLVACSSGPDDTPYAERVEIRRTRYGVPHIVAEDLGALAYGLAWAHMEDYGQDLVHRLVRVRGELSAHFGADSLDSDFWWRRRHRQAEEAYADLHADARALYEGYATAINDYIDKNPGDFPEWVDADWGGPDIAAHWVDESYQPHVDRFLRAERTRREADALAAAGDGSNAWAFGPSRTASDHSILIRNPHLRWGSGYYGAYYEAHITVPGVIDFYGDFRVGYPMYFNGGFNRHLGWATTNNSPDVDEVYALRVDPARGDHYMFGGESRPFEIETHTVPFLVNGGLEPETREYRNTIVGPVIDDGDGVVYVMRSADWNGYRRTEQFLRMMQASSLEEWKDAMRMRAMTESSFTYADRDGNIFYVWNAALPVLPHPSGRDTAATPASGWDDVWTELVPFDSLPQVLNPPGGYLHNENDSFHYTSLEAPLEPADLNAAWQEKRLRLRSQLALQLVRSAEDLSLEEAIQLKHSPRMLLADRVKDDLVTAVRTSNAGAEELAAIQVLESWDNTAAAVSRGSVLFEVWWRAYTDRAEEAFAEPWTTDRPTDTPRGLGDPETAASAFASAVTETREAYGSADVTWGEVHRVRRGDVDVPVSGCPAGLGCFRHLGFRETGDGRLEAYTGDAWILAVEFGEEPRAYSVLVFGQSPRPESPHYADQTEMFARGELKPVAFSEAEIAEQLVRTYRPGE